MNPSASTNMHVVIACGGTGGHVYPALAIGKAIVAAGGRVTLMLSGQNLAAHLQIAADNGFPAVATGCFRQPRAARELALLPLTAARAVLQASLHLRRLRPDAVLTMGSFAGVAPALASVIGRVPLFLHEGNTIVGKANRFLSRYARHLALSLPLAAQPQKLGCPTSLTGFPLRPELAAALATAPDPAACRRALGLAPQLPTLLVFGGSQGAQALNQTLQQALPQLAATMPQLQILHLTGSDANQAFTDAYAACGITAVVKAREINMHLAYGAADLVLCRAGAGTITELALFAKPALLVPLPGAADNHQHTNAECAAATGGALLLPQSALDANCLATQLQQWLHDPDALRRRGLKLHKLAYPDAATAVARLLSAETAGATWQA